VALTPTGQQKNCPSATAANIGSGRGQFQVKSNYTPCLKKMCIFVSVRTSSNFH